MVKVALRKYDFTNYYGWSQTFDRYYIYISISKNTYILTINTFSEWYNFLLINKYSLSASGGKMATCVPSIAPITPGKPLFVKNLKVKHYFNTIFLSLKAYQLKLIFNVIIQDKIIYYKDLTTN